MYRESEKTRTRGAVKKILCVIAAVLVTAAIAFLVYAGIYYRADAVCYEDIAHPADGITITVEDKRIIVGPENPKAGFIFYPGGKVEDKAYIPLMEKLAERNFKCVIVHVPFNLAIFDMNAAAGIPEEFPNLEWYVGGHSLGGVAASKYASENADKIEGIAFLGAYPMADLSGTDMSAVSIYGSEDGLLNREKYEESLSMMPADFTEFVLDGGCHAGFGNYGAQKKDGVPSMSADEQQDETARLVADFFE